MVPSGADVEGVAKDVDVVGQVEEDAPRREVVSARAPLGMKGMANTRPRLHRWRLR